ncbi:type I methionyl aminopeptidase [bacterium]|nr:type I methionyl aminopeptidase [bacterium]
MAGSHGIYLKSAAELAIMRKGGLMLEQVLQEVAAAAVEGTTTAELDRIAFSRIKAMKAKPAFKGLYGFPATLCTSFNEEVVHGIPGKRKLQVGDILSIDCGLIYNGFYADSAITVAVGEISAEARRLMDVTFESLWKGIHAAQPGGRVSDIGAAIEEHVRAAGFHPTDNYTGHGVGRQLHEEPKVFNSALPRGPRLVPGMTLAVEPMINIGTSAAVELSDGWTVVTKDRSLSAHFEHTIAITQTGVEVLTCSNPR